MENTENLNENFSDGKGLIMVHINKARDENYYWDWSSDAKGWIRGEEIPQNLKFGYSNPHVKSNY